MPWRWGGGCQIPCGMLGATSCGPAQRRRCRVAGEVANAPRRQSLGPVPEISAGLAGVDGSLAAERAYLGHRGRDQSRHVREWASEIANLGGFVALAAWAEGFQPAPSPSRLRSPPFPCVARQVSDSVKTGRPGSPGGAKGLQFRRDMGGFWVGGESLRFAPRWSVTKCDVRVAPSVCRACQKNFGEAQKKHALTEQMNNSAGG